MPILEAQATGRPVVTSNILSMPWVAGEAACLVDPFDTASIRGGLTRVMGDPSYRAALVALGFENVKRFSAEEIARQYLELYLDVAAQDR
jgi:glycosyltransferase involved in cell wall biosynthesis